MAVKYLQWHIGGPGWYHDGGGTPTWKGPFDTSIKATRAFMIAEQNHPEPTVVVSTTEVDQNGDHIEKEIPVSWFDEPEPDPLDQPLTMRQFLAIIHAAAESLTRK